MKKTTNSGEIKSVEKHNSKNSEQISEQIY